jgi:hypothetical protein
MAAKNRIKKYEIKESWGWKEGRSCYNGSNRKNKRSLRKKRNRNIVRRGQSAHGVIPLKISK